MLPYLPLLVTLCYVAITLCYLMLQNINVLQKKCNKNRKHKHSHTLVVYIPPAVKLVGPHLNPK